MRKKISYCLIALVLFFASVPAVFAASGTTSITGTNTIKQGKTTQIYIRINSSAAIEGADVTYSTTGNISVTNVAIGSGFTKMGQDGRRYILYAQNPRPSGSAVLVLTVKGTAVGKGTVTVNRMEATVSGTTVNCGSKSYTITVTEAMTAAERKAAEEAAKKAAEEQAKKEAARKEAEKKALELVEKAEKSLSDSDYETALKAVNALENGGVKTDLLNRLNEVKFKIAVKKECGSKQTAPSSPTDTCECGEAKGNTKSWIVLCIILFVCLLLETIFLITKLSKKEDYE